MGRSRFFGCPCFACSMLDDLTAARCDSHRERYGVITAYNVSTTNFRSVQTKNTWHTKNYATCSSFSLSRKKNAGALKKKCSMDRCTYGTSFLLCVFFFPWVCWRSHDVCIYALKILPNWNENPIFESHFHQILQGWRVEDSFKSWVGPWFGNSFTETVM